MINRKTLDIINTIHKSNDFGKINIIERNNPIKKSLSVGNKKTEIKNYINNDYNLNYKNKDNIDNINNINNKNDYFENEINSNSKRVRYNSEKGYNVNFNSYFKMNKTDNNINYNKPYYNLNYINENSNEQSLSSYIDETNNYNKNEYINKKNNNSPNNNKKYRISLTPNGLYRNHIVENNKTFNNITPKENTKLFYNHNYYNNSKSNLGEGTSINLSTNNYNTVTQTRYYRNRVFPESNKIKSLNAINEYNRSCQINNNNNKIKKQNSLRTFSNLNFDLDKDYINNVKNYNNYIPKSNNNNIFNNYNKYTPISNNNNIFNNKYNTLTNITRNSNLYQNNKYNTKLNSCRYKYTLKKRRTSKDIDNILDPRNKNDNNIVNSLIVNLSKEKRNDYNIDYGISPTIIKNIKYNNTVYNSINKNKNNLNNQYFSHLNLCSKCGGRHLFNGDNKNGFRNSNTLRSCSTSKNLYIKENTNNF